MRQTACMGSPSVALSFKIVHNKYIFTVRVVLAFVCECKLTTGDVARDPVSRHSASLSSYQLFRMVCVVGCEVQQDVGACAHVSTSFRSIVSQQERLVAPVNGIVVNPVLILLLEVTTFNIEPLLALHLPALPLEVAGTQRCLRSIIQNTRIVVAEVLVPHTVDEGYPLVPSQAIRVAHLVRRARVRRLSYSKSYMSHVSYLNEQKGHLT